MASFETDANDSDDTDRPESDAVMRASPLSDAASTPTHSCSGISFPIHTSLTLGSLGLVFVLRELFSRIVYNPLPVICIFISMHRVRGVHRESAPAEPGAELKRSARVSARRDVVPDSPLNRMLRDAETKVSTRTSTEDSSAQFDAMNSIDFMELEGSINVIVRDVVQWPEQRELLSCRHLRTLEHNAKERLALCSRCTLACIVDSCDWSKKDKESLTMDMKYARLSEIVRKLPFPWPATTPKSNTTEGKTATSPRPEKEAEEVEAPEQDAETDGVQTGPSSSASSTGGAAATEDYVDDAAAEASAPAAAAADQEVGNDYDDA